MSDDRSKDAPRPRKPGETPPKPVRRPQPPPSVSPAARRPVAPDEAEILRAGVAERLELARQTAHEALADPTTLTPTRLARLGRDGLAQFVAELRRATFGQVAKPRRTEAATPAAPVPVPRHSSAAQRRATDATSRSKLEPTAAPDAAFRPTPRVGRIAGWWQSIDLDDVRIDASARKYGYCAGFITLVATVSLLLTWRL
jgi:hypothetical protein